MCQDNWHERKPTFLAPSSAYFGKWKWHTSSMFSSLKLKVADWTTLYTILPYHHSKSLFLWNQWLMWPYFLTKFLETKPSASQSQKENMPTDKQNSLSHTHLNKFAKCFTSKQNMAKYVPVYHSFLSQLLCHLISL